jgi:hypothetical protein
MTNVLTSTVPSRRARRVRLDARRVTPLTGAGDTGRSHMYIGVGLVVLILVILLLIGILR